MSLPAIDHLAVWVDAVATKKVSGRGASRSRKKIGFDCLKELILRACLAGKLSTQKQTEHVHSDLQIANPKLFVSPFEIPKNWIWVFLPDIAEYKTGRTPSTKNPKYWAAENEGFNWVSISDLNHKGYVNNTTKRVSSKSKEEIFKCPPVKAGTILMSFKLTVGKTSILNVDAYHNEAIIGIHPNQYITQDYLFHLLPVMSQWGSTKDAIKGKTLNLKSIAKIPVPLPPLEEQKRIVAKVNELMGVIDDLETQTDIAHVRRTELTDALLRALVESEDADALAQNWKTLSEHFDTLFTTGENVEKLKVAILDLAVRGKLSSRKDGESADSFLSSVQQDKSSMAKGGEIKKNLVAVNDTSKPRPFQIPKSWVWSSLGQLAILITSGSRGWAKYLSDEGAKFVTMGNLSRGSFNIRLKKMHFVDLPETIEGARTSLIENDMLISITGDVGNLARIPENFGEAYVNQHTCVLRFHPRCRSKYFSYFLLSTHAQKQFNEPQRGIKNSFRLSDVKYMTIPLPPFEEQDRIVAQIDKCFLLCDKILENIRDSEALKVELAKSVVHHASAD